MIAVKLKVDSRLNADFLRWLYPAADDDKSLKVSSDIFGKLLISHCKTASLPHDEPAGEWTFTLLLPRNQATQTLENKWLYYSPSDTAALNMALSAFFDLDFRSYYLRGVELGIRKKDIIEAYIVSRNLFSTDCFDALHKRIYRRTQATMAKLTEKLVRKAYYINESIDYKGLEQYDKNH